MSETQEPRKSGSHDRIDRVVHGERIELLRNVNDVLEPMMAVLGIVFLVLVLMQFMSIALDIHGVNRVSELIQVIWIIFVLDFLLRFWIAPEKKRYLQRNWFLALTLVIPFLRPLRAFHAVGVVRQMNLVWFLGGINHGMRVVRKVTRGRQFAFVLGLTLVVIVGAAVGARYFEAGNPAATIHTFDDALWWSAMQVTTIGSEFYLVTFEARIIGFLEAVYALSVFGFITASIASYFVGADSSTSDESVLSPDDRKMLQSLRDEIGELRSALNERS